VFVALPDGKRYAFLGDLVWQREGILEREERPWFWRRVVDRDPEAVRASILRVAAPCRVSRAPRSRRRVDPGKVRGCRRLVLSSSCSLPSRP
jgi:hypothetical protein